MSQEQQPNKDLEKLPLDDLVLMRARVDQAIRSQRIQKVLAMIREMRERGVARHNKIDTLVDLLITEYQGACRHVFVDDYLDKIELLLPI